MAAPAAPAAPLDPMELRLRERARYLTALQKYDQRLYDPTDMLIKARDITYGIKPERNAQYDLPPHIIASAHISTAMQGSIVPGAGIRSRTRKDDVALRAICCQNRHATRYW